MCGVARVLAHGAVNASTNYLPTTWLPTAATFTAIGLLAVIVAVATHGRLGADQRDAANSPAASSA